MVVTAMREAGIDISHQKPKAMTAEMLEQADRVITMGCGAEAVCPAAFVPTEDWSLDDPKDKTLEQVRQVRDEIKRRVTRLWEEMLKEPESKEDKFRD